MQFLPALRNIAEGDLHFVGVRPRDRDEALALPEDWLALYRESKAGVVTEAYVNYGEHPTDDEVYTSEAFYSVQSSFRHDMRILFRYFTRMLVGWPALPPEDEAFDYKAIMKDLLKDEEEVPAVADVAEPENVRSETESVPA